MHLTNLHWSDARDTYVWSTYTGHTHGTHASDLFTLVTRTGHLRLTYLHWSHAQDTCIWPTYTGHTQGTHTSDLLTLVTRKGHIRPAYLQSTTSRTNNREIVAVNHSTVATHLLRSTLVLITRARLDINDTQALTFGCLTFCVPHRLCVIRLIMECFDEI